MVANDPDTVRVVEHTYFASSELNALERISLIFKTPTGCLMRPIIRPVDVRISNNIFYRAIKIATMSSGTKLQVKLEAMNYEGCFNL